MPELREGDAVGPYVLESAIDRGAFGRVWRGHDRMSGRTVAIKVLSSDGADSERDRARTDLERLAGAAARDSRHIVRVLSGGHEPVPHIVMEFVDGTNLRDELADRGALPQEEVIRIGLQIADALRALHRVRIVHRDVKPANILLDQSGEVRLTDFGIAKILGYDETVTLTQQNLLSAPYAAPEVWEGAPNPSSDLYALGAVLFEMLAGRPPFQGTLMDLFRQHRSEEADFGLLPPHVAPSLAELVYSCLRKNVDERPPDADTVIRSLERAGQELRREPDQFGPWQRIDEEPVDLWAWRCRHEKTGEEAIVEVHFVHDEAYGDALRAAVNLNPKLVPLGAEKLLGTNRLLLADDEGWASAPEHNLAFWVARQDGGDVEPAAELQREQLLRAAESLTRMIDTAAAAGVRLSIDADRTVVLPDGAVYLRRPGLPPLAPVEPRLGAFIFLRSLTLSAEASEAAAGARDLRDLRERLSRPGGVPGRPGRGGAGRSPVLLFGLGALAASLVAAVVGVALLDGGGGSGQSGVTGPTAVPSAVPCAEVKTPATLSSVRSACANVTLGAVEFASDCARGQVCRIESRAGSIILHGNDRTIAYVDGAGDLQLAREGSLERTRLAVGPARDASWSPDGLYVAYVEQRGTAQGTATELVIQDARDLTSGATLFSATDGPDVPDFAKRRIGSPVWSGDGRTLYFLWTPPAGPSEVWAIQLPYGANNLLDFRELRSWTPQSTDRLNTASLPGLDQATTRVESIGMAPDGALLVEYCSTTDPGCGLARWGSSFDIVVEPAPGARFLSPVQVGDRIYALAPESGDAILLSVTRESGPSGVARVPMGGGPEGPDHSALSLALSGDGSQALVGTPLGLFLVALPGGEDVRRVLEGSWASWYSPAMAIPSVSPPPVAPFATPIRTPATPPSPTPPPAGNTDLAVEVVQGSCVGGQTLRLRVRNLGPRSVDERGVFLQIQSSGGTVVQGQTLLSSLLGLRPGEARDVVTTYTVAGVAVEARITYSGDNQPDNSRTTCTP